MMHSEATRTREWTGRVFIATSMDGFIARPDGDIGWLTAPPGGRDHVAVDTSVPAETWETFFPAVDHLVMGRGTYEKVASFDAWPYGEKSVIVVSSTLNDDDARVTVVPDVATACAQLDARGAKQVYVDGGRVIQTFLREGLVDEITVTSVPVLLGQGIPLFGALDHDVHLTLRATHADGGMVTSTYAVARSNASA